LNPATTPCLIFNPSARGGKARRFRSNLPAFRCAFLPTTGPGDGRRLASQAVREGFQTIIAAGGDGTVNEVLNGIGDVPGALSSVRLGILPMGTVNVLARELQVPLNLRRAWEVVEAGRERTMDLGCVEFTAEGKTQRRLFVQLAGAGLDSRAIERTRWKIKQRVGPLAYVVAGLEALRPPCPQLRVSPGKDCKCEFPGLNFPLSGEWIAIGNGRYYGGPVAVFPAARMDDGLLDVCVLPRVTLAVVAAAAAGVCTGRVHRFLRSRLFQTTSVRMESDVPVPLQLDGENVGHLPATISVMPKALRIIAF
jgi:YegS/Rv2252/BmrU family lipid kinase